MRGLVVVLVAAVALSLPRAEPRSAAIGHQSTALSVLHAWDARRSRAWAAGDVSMLRALYVPGSSASRADVGLLRRYLARGVAVRGLVMQTLAARVVRQEPDHLTLWVHERLDRARVTTGRGTVALPGSVPRTRRVDLRRIDGRWLMVSVTSGLSASRAPPAPRP